MGEKIERILKTDLKSILNPNIWLLIVAIPHTLFGALVPMYQTSYGSNEFSAASYGLVTAIMLLSIYLFSSGKSLARMTAFLGTSVFLWIIFVQMLAEGGGFNIEAELAPPFIYSISLNVELAPPLLLWGMLGFSGFLHWNIEDDENPSEKKEEMEDDGHSLDEILELSDNKNDS
jgi:hypothetical protein|tara:strand:+ start:996 stop:1520 length:525 start_codon:yes stop_codon:yes gene_type:complete